jgi:uncharacterized membrane protein YfcA
VDGQTVFVANLIIGAAAALSALTGFGYALVAAPFLVLVFPPQLVVPVVMVSWVPLAVLLFREARGEMSYPRIGRWLIGAVLGIPLGVYGLTTIAEGSMRAAIGAITVATALTLWLKPARPLRHEALVAPAVGFASGLLGGASGMSGPPVVLFALNQGWEPREIRANLIGYFVSKHVLALAFLREFGVLDRQVLLLSLASLPGLAIGSGVGLYLKDRVSQRHFRVLAFVLVLAGGLLAVIKH